MGGVMAPVLDSWVLLWGNTRYTVHVVRQRMAVYTC
jgi:hypothetical protein